MSLDRIGWPNDLDDSSSFTGSLFTTSSTSTVPGPGAIAGKFLKAVGERSLDLMVSLAIRSRLAAIERTLEKTPQVFRDPVGGREWETMIGIYKDLRELCRKSSSAYYPVSHQRAAAKLIRDITLMTRSAPDSHTDASPTNEKWEELFARVKQREELLANSSKRTLASSRRSDPLQEAPHTNVYVKPETYDHSNGQPLQATRIRRAIMSLARVLRFRTPVAAVVPQKPRNPTRKVLVFGAGGAGKSTLVKQIRAALNGSSKQDFKPYRDVIIQNMMETLWSILLHVDPLDLSEDSRVLFQQALDECDQIHRNRVPDYGFADSINTLWKDPVVRRSASQSRLGRLSQPPLEAADHFFDSVHRIYTPGYKPTYDDYVRCSVRTTGIWKNEFRIDGYPWTVVDTGGELSERKKWVNCSGEATAIIFVVALSDYNKTLKEDPDVNRMHDSLTLFYWVMRSAWFKGPLVILLFNKLDLFMETLESAPLTDYFPDYSGEDGDDACQYLEHLFLNLVEDKDRQVIVKYGCAVNTEATLGTFRSIKDEINLHYMQN